MHGGLCETGGMEYTTIHLMRHGEVDNPQGILYGRMPGYGLTKRGKQMVQASVDFLVAEQSDIAKIVASPLMRAQQSAAPAALAFAVPIETDQRLMEAGNIFEGMSVRNNLWKLAAPKWWKYYVDPMRPSWGESYAQIAERMAAVVSEVIDQASGREALLVTHQSPIVALRRFVERQPLGHLPTRRQCSLASLTSLTFLGHTLVGLSYQEPAAPLLSGAYDMVPGQSAAKQR